MVHQVQVQQLPMKNSTQVEKKYDLTQLIANGHNFNVLFT